MKLYDLGSHRSFEIDPDSVNVYATKRHLDGVFLHECADKYKTPGGCGVIVVSHKVWKKLINTSRKSW